MAKSTKKQRGVTRDPLIARAGKTLKSAKASKVLKQLKSKKGKPGQAPIAHPAASALGPAITDSGAAVLDRLFATVTTRRNADPAVSHSARLLSRGTAKVAQKFGEEAVECLIEAVAGNRDALIAESADVLYHLIVVWVASGVLPDEIWEELRRREGISGIAEKAARVKSLPVAFGPHTTKIP